MPATVLSQTDARHNRALSSEAEQEKKHLTATTGTRADTADATVWQKSGVCQSATTCTSEDAEFPAANERSLKPIRSLGHTLAETENMKTMANLRTCPNPSQPPFSVKQIQDTTERSAELSGANGSGAGKRNI